MIAHSAAACEFSEYVRGLTHEDLAKFTRREARAQGCERLGALAEDLLEAVEAEEDSSEIAEKIYTTMRA